jgi:hypothetical protein
MAPCAVCFRRRGVIERVAGECPLFDRERAFVAAVLAGRSCPILLKKSASIFL